mgnify:CR=1 FL=1
MSLLKVTGAILAVLAGIVVLCVGVIRWEKRYSDEKDEKYDERQRYAQGNAYKLCFYVSLCYYLGLLFCMPFMEEMESAYMLMFIGVGLQLMVYHIYCLLSHAALPLSETDRPWRVIYTYSGLWVINIIQFVGGLLEKAEDLTNLSGDAMRNLMLSVIWGSLALMHLIQYFYDRKE